MWKQGEKLLQGLGDIASRLAVSVRLEGAGPIPFFGFTKESAGLATSFYPLLMDHGVYFPKGHIWFMSLSHTDDILTHTLEAVETALKQSLAESDEHC